MNDKELVESISTLTPEQMYVLKLGLEYRKKKNAEKRKRKARHARRSRSAAEK